VTDRLRYPCRAIVTEGLQGAIGFALAAGLLVHAEPAGPVLWASAAAAGLFLVYSARAVVRYLTRIEIDEKGIRTLCPLGAEISWGEMRSIRLNHYTTRNDRSGGWMQLVVRGAGASIRIDSSLGGFAGLAAAVGREALQRGAQLDEPTRSNLNALGIRLND